MTKKAEFVDRRGSIRLKIPVAIAYAGPQNTRVHNVMAKDISGEGARFEAHDKRIKESEVVDMKLLIPDSSKPVAVKAKVIWKKRLSLEDRSPYDIGIEFTEITEEGKNAFLKFLCDYIYKLPEEKKNAKNTD